MTKQALLILARNPEVGKVKTRLAATMGNEAALAVYNQLLNHTVSVTAFLPLDKFVFYSDYIPEEDIWTNKYYNKELQQGPDLGERIKNAFIAIFKKGYEKVVTIGTDCPDLSEDLMLKAFDRLQKNDVVIGPAEDGGYYLIGIKELHPQLFEDIEWSTTNVLTDTIAKCKALGLGYHLLPVLQDIDEEKDLQTFKL